MPSLAKQHVWELGVRVPNMQRREPRRDRTWGRKLPVGPWSRSAGRQTTNLGPRELTFGAIQCP